MTILTVGPNSDYSNITSAMADAHGGDEFSLEAGYSGDKAVIGINDGFVSGAASSTGIRLTLGSGIGNVTLMGAAPIDVRDNAANNTITGNAGANMITVSSGADVAHGGAGIDRLVVNYATATLSVIGSDVNVSDGGIHSVTFDGFENFTVTTGTGNDTLTLGDGNNIFVTGGGDDTVTSGNGRNHANTGRGNDTATFGDGNNRVTGGKGNDTISAGDGKNLVDAGLGDDTVTTGDGGSRIIGGRGNDTLTSGDSKDVIDAGLGDDTVISGAGKDKVFVSGGIDTVDAGAGGDRLFVDYSSSTTDVTGSVAGSLAGGYTGTIADVAGTSSTEFTFVESFRIETGSGNDTVTSGGGRDVLVGNGGHDILNAGGGTDRLMGGAGNDVLIGGKGAGDELSGGRGADTFRYSDVSQSTGIGYDVIVGFTAHVDQFDLDVAVTGIDSAVRHGQLDEATYDADLEAAIKASRLDAHHAVFFRPDSGSDAGDLYIIVDANGVAGFQAGEDYVFEIEDGHHMGALSTGDFI